MPLLPCHISLLQRNLSTFAMGCPSKTCECKIRSSTSFLVVDTIPYVIAGTCSTSMNANLSFLLLNLIFAAILLCTGIPSLLFWRRAHNSQEYTRDKTFHCGAMWIQEFVASRFPSWFEVWLWFLLYCMKWYISTIAWNQAILYGCDSTEIDRVWRKQTQWTLSAKTTNINSTLNIHLKELVLHCSTL